MNPLATGWMDVLAVMLAAFAAGMAVLSCAVHRPVPVRSAAPSKPVLSAARMVRRARGPGMSREF